MLSRTLAMSWSRSAKSVSSNVVALNEAEMPPSESGMSWMVKNSIGGVGESGGAVAPACMSSIYFSVLHDRRPRIQAAANKAEGQSQAYQGGLFRANTEVEFTKKVLGEANFPSSVPERARNGYCTKRLRGSSTI